MLRSPAIAWVKGNCPNPKLYQDVVRFLDDADADGDDPFFIFGGGLTRKRAPFLLQCFAEEVFIFQLTDSQAKAAGVGPIEMRRGKNPRTIPSDRAKPVIAIKRFELKETSLTQSQPIVGQIDYEVQAEADGDYCVRLDSFMGSVVRAAWDYPRRPLSGKGSLDVTFAPIAPEPDLHTRGFKGPLVMFVHLAAITPGAKAEARLPISNCVGTLVEIV